MPTSATARITPPDAAAATGTGDLVPWAGALLALLIAACLFLQFSIDDVLKRDEAIYAYGGQQLAEGVAPYASIFDPKTPLATIIAGVATIGGRAVGAHDGAGDVHAMRIVFLVFALLTVLAVYLLGLRLWGSVLAALTGAVVFSSFRGFALDALGGPNAKTPGIFFGVLSMALLGAGSGEGSPARSRSWSGSRSGSTWRSRSSPRRWCRSRAAGCGRRCLRWPA